MAFSAREKMRAAQREAGFRRRVYTRLVEQGRMNQKKADEEIALMDEIAAEYGAAAEAEEKAGRLL